MATFRLSIFKHTLCGFNEAPLWLLISKFGSSRIACVAYQHLPTRHLLFCRGRSPKQRPHLTHLEFEDKLRKEFPRDF